MPVLIILSLPVIEILVGIWVADEIGLMNAIMLLLGAFFIGLGILKMTGKSFLVELQLRASRGEQLENVLLSQALRFFAGVLLIIPGFITDAMALFTLVASLVPSLFSKPINRNMKQWNSNFVVFTSQTSPQPGPHSRPSWATERDVTPGDPQIIDVLPEKPDAKD